MSVDGDGGSWFSPVMVVSPLPRSAKQTASALFSLADIPFISPGSRVITSIFSNFFVLLV